MDDQNKNLILATVLSFAVILAWTLIFPPPEAPVDVPAEVAGETATGSTVPIVESGTGDGAVSGGAADPTAPADRADAARVVIETAQFSGSLSLRGGRIDDLALTNYRETLDPGADTVRLMRPVGETDAYLALFGWTGDAESAPNDETIWSLIEGDTLTPDTPVTLGWDNGQGQQFQTRISVDDEFMFTFDQSVINNGSGDFTSRPYGLIRRYSEPDDMKNFFILHEGLVQMTDGELTETDYDDIVDFEPDGPDARKEVTQNGWIGWTDHYWMTNLIPAAEAPFRASVRYFDNRDIYQAEAIMAPQVVSAGGTATVSTRFFAGAKEWESIRNYQDDSEAPVPGFLDSIDWGWFFFLTKPIFALLHYLNAFIGNMGWSIIALTFILKALVLPLTYKSSVSMARMKELQPEMEALKEKAGDDRAAMQQGMMKLYKEKKVNPAAGCLPILLQIPIFFSLYKVIFVTIELRHAPWFGWIKDLSAPDPSSLMNLFGLLPWAAPEPGSFLALIMIGILPILLGVSMWLQQKLNPAPTDPTQQMIFAWMPWVFMFMLGSFASGLVVYWITNNIITFGQQYVILRSLGNKPDVFGNIKSGFKRGKSATTGKSEDK
ncbi:membrane protein insertase YidC [Yoonia sediminilitoris]|uniref:Membrane protein insertase YidC n=1 Tax=Yoonia sediminilitoris TaxID=1286148 RepID=A0A2T6KFV8_9RHOB|nr:membrane protein insertase YidC [Yoonia sediminilitoris]PUB14184.1 protein translocase subunit yidC [Yoonia sediminilitoris]RCW95115.1 protein translocase subunit yidC [Yoonia sediminilitoris]